MAELKMVKAWVNKHLLKLNNKFKNNPFSEFNVKVQNGVPVDAKKISNVEKLNKR